MAKKEKKVIPAVLKADDLKGRLKEAEEKLAKLRVDKNAGRLKNTNALKKSQKEIARIKTSIREKELSL